MSDIAGLAKSLSAQQTELTKEQMLASHETSMANSENTHAQKEMGKEQENDRSMRNDRDKRAESAQADEQALMKASQQKMDQSAGA